MHIPVKSLKQESPTIPVRVRGRASILKSTFDESKHKRSADGRFASFALDDIDFGEDDGAIGAAGFDYDPDEWVGAIAEVPKQHQSAVKKFLARTKGMTVGADEFDAAYDALSDAIPNFDDFEQVSMILGLA